MANLKIIAGISIVVGLVGIIFLSLLYSLTGGDIPFDYGVIVDAGSSHSEALLYQWKGDKYKGTGYVTEIDKCNVEEGISSFANPEDAGGSLLPCLQKVGQKIPEETRGDTPVYVAATAGMRLLNVSNPYLNMATFIAIKCAIPKSGMSQREVGIISGQDEGIFAWITSNFLLENLQSKTHEPTVGSVDMGGASTQISFEVSPEFQNRSDVKTLTIYGEKYHVFSVSYLCYGANEIHRRYLSSIVDLESPLEEADSPCHHEGWEGVYSADDIFNQPCTETPPTRQALLIKPELLTKNFTIKGKSNSDECNKKMKEVFSYEYCTNKNYKECFRPIESVMRPEKFMAFSSYFFTTDFLNAKNTTFEVYKDKVQKLCEMTWAEVETTYPSAKADVLPKFCMQGHAIDVILTYGYNFTSETWHDITFTRKIGTTTVGWALGYMINATNALPEESVEPAAINATTFIILIIVCIILLVVGFFFCYKSQSRKKPQRQLP